MPGTTSAVETPMNQAPQQSFPLAVNDWPSDAARFVMLAENTDDVFWFVDVQPFRVTYVNPAMERLIGIPAEAVCADPQVWNRVAHPDDAAQVKQAFQAWISGESPRYDQVYRVTGTDGKTRWVADRGIAVQRENGMPARACGISRDITELKAAADEVQKSEQRFRAVVEAAPDALLIHDRDGLIKIANAQAEKLFGYDRVELIGQPMEILMPERFREKHRLHRDRYFPTAQPRPMGIGLELTAQHKNGREIPVEISLSRLEAAEGTLVMSSVRDITERVKAEESLRQLNERLEDRVAQRTAALRIANEDLRAEIAARRRLEEEILEISEREQQRIGQDLHDDLGQQLAGAWMMSAALHRTLTRQKGAGADEARKIAELLQRAVSMTRSLARGLQPVVPEPEGLATALRDLACQATEMFGIECQLENHPDVLVADTKTATHLYRIAQEAIHNAVRHGKASRIVISLAESADGGILLTIMDNGSGIGPLDPNRPGMGVRIMHYRADMIGGRLAIEPQVGGGTRVACQLPREAAPMRASKPRKRNAAEKTG